MRYAVVLAALASIGAVSAEVISTADGSVTFQCPVSLTAENAYANETPATLLSDAPINADQVSVDYGSDGDRSTATVYLFGSYDDDGDASRLCLWYKDISAGAYTVGDDNEPCRQPDMASIPTGGLSRRKAYFPQSKRAMNFPQPQFNCPLEATTAGYQRATDQSPGANIITCNFENAQGCAYDFSTGERIVPSGDDQGGVCPASLCTSVYTRKRGLEDTAITRRHYRPSSKRQK